MKKSLFTLACLALLSAPALIAQGPGMSPGGPHEMRGEMHGGMTMMGPGGMWWKNPHIIQLLTLTADQQKKMNDIFEDSRIKLIDLHANVQKAEVPMEALLAANPPDTNKVLSQIDKLASARAELEKADARMLLGIRGVLTPDQWTKLQAEEHSHHGSMRGDKSKGASQGGRPSGPGGPGGPGSMWRGQGRPGGNAPPPPPQGAPATPPTA